MSPQAVGSGVVTLGFFLFLEVVLLEKLENEKKGFFAQEEAQNCLKWQVIIRNDVFGDFFGRTILHSLTFLTKF